MSRRTGSMAVRSGPDRLVLGLANLFRVGTRGRTPCVGMRTAWASRHPIANFRRGNPHLNTRRRAHLFLVPISEDEGTVENMFNAAKPFDSLDPIPLPSPLAPGDRFDAVLVVRLRYRFRFHRDIPNKDRWEAMKVSFHDKHFFDEAASPRIRFLLSGGSRFRRNALLFQPQYAYGRRVAGARSDQILVIHPDPATEHEPFIADDLPRSIPLHYGQLTAWPILRYALGLATWRLVPASAGPPPVPAYRVPDDRPLAAGDLQLLATEVDGMLGEPLGTHRVLPF